MAFFSTFFIGGVLLITGLIKSVYLQPFVGHVAQFRIFPKKINVLAALLFVEIECGLGISLMLHVYPQELIPFCILLFVFLSILSLWANKSGRTRDCGCYGGLVSLALWQSMVLNLLYLTILAIGWVSIVEGDATGMWKIWIVIITILASGYLAKQSVKSPLIDFSKLKKGHRWQVEWIDDELFQTDTVLVIFLNINCHICEEWVADIKYLQSQQNSPSTVLIFPAEPDVNNFILSKIDGKFPSFQINPQLFHRLVFQTPTAVLIVNGIMQEKWIAQFPDLLK